MSILNQTLTVEEVSSRIQALITGDPVLQSLNVKGEILEFKKHGSGHVYFTLSGEDARLSGVMFRSDTRNVPQWPKQGDEVIVQGRIAIYPAPKFLSDLCPKYCTRWSWCCCQGT